jgi:hypothetical protein
MILSSTLVDALSCCHVDNVPTLTGNLGRVSNSNTHTCYAMPYAPLIVIGSVYARLFAPTLIMLISCSTNAEHNNLSIL